MMLKPMFTAIGLLFASALANPALAHDPETAETDLRPGWKHPGADPSLSDREQLFAYERRIYESRGEGDANYYASLIHPNYMGWPPMLNGPATTEFFPAQPLDKPNENLLGENIDFYEMDATFAGDMAMTYFVGHRTVTGGSQEPADDWFDNIHVWVKEDNGLWYLMGGIARQMPAERRAFLLERDD